MKQSVNKFFTPLSERANRYYIDDFDPEKKPENNYVAILSEYIPEESRVLDLGCAQGRFSSILKKKKCYAVGVELDPVSAECAQKTGAYEKIYIGDMTDNKSDIYKELYTLPKFDVIIMTDVLEHIVEPTEMIRMYYALLNVGGVILVSVPNFANIKVALELLNNQIAYDDVGILDNTHLKWYTKISFAQWMNQINNTYEDVRLDCKYLGATVYRDDISRFVMQQYPELYNILLNNDNLNSFQILFQLTKKETHTHCSELEELLQTPYPDIVGMIGDSLHGKGTCSIDKKIQHNERVQYEKQIEQLESDLDDARYEWKKCADAWKESVTANEQLEEELVEARKSWDECADAWKKAVDSNSQMEKELAEARKGWEECALNWKAAVDASNIKDQEIDELKEEFEKRENSLKQKINALYLRIDEIESNLNPIMERDLELQKENNKFREERSRT